MAATQLLLVVDDEVLILNMSQDGLADAGYEVVQATTGQDALNHLEADAARFGGVVTDIRLGAGPDGWRIGERARELSPHIQVIYVSGDSGKNGPRRACPTA